MNNFFDELESDMSKIYQSSKSVDIDVLYKKAIEVWSPDFQLRQVQEESAELVVAISHFIRKGDDKSAKDLVEEVVDTQIMLEQIKVIMENNYGFSEYQNMYDEIREFKLKRLQERLSEY